MTTGPSRNIDGKELSVRTFHRYREEIANLFGIEIECDKADGSDYHPRVLPFDRISYLEIVCEKQLLSKRTQKLLNPDNFYDGCFGIIRQQNLPPRKIRIRAFYPENHYIEEVPIHESQTKIRDAADGSYTDYELYVSPTRDFEQELLWHGRKVIVLSPDDFRLEMTGILKDMVRSYETGENTVEE